VLLDFTNDRDRIASAVRQAATMKSPQVAFFNEAVYQATNQLAKLDAASYRQPFVGSPTTTPTLRRQRTDGPPIWRKTLSFTPKTKRTRRCIPPTPDLCHQSGCEKSNAANGGKYPAGDIGEYTERTAGLVLKAGKANIDAKVGELLDAIRSRYVVSFRPAENTKPGEFRRIEVRLTRQDAKD
jgi:hypothetical protein